MVYLTELKRVTKENTHGEVIIHCLQQRRRTPFIQREKISNLIEDMQQRGVIQPSASALASPIVIVPKKNDTLRFCINFHRVNVVTKRMFILFQESMTCLTYSVEHSISPHLI